MEKNYDSSIKPISYDEIVHPSEVTSGEKTAHRFFAAANSEKGFISYFPEVFGGADIERLYILGGGPGSGKSTMMKRVAEISDQNGFTTQRIHCSSSPFSLDGVIVTEKKIAVIDGTAPHTYVPYAAGVREIAVDPGAAWDKNALFARREKIFGLTDAKKKEYRKAYIYIRAAGLLSKEMREMAYPYILEEKLDKYVNMLGQKVLSKAAKCDYSECVRIQRAVSGMGNVYFDSFSCMAEKTYKVADFKEIAHVLFEKLLKLAKAKGCNVTVSYTPENPELVDGIIFNDSKIAFTVHCTAYDKIINCERFADRTAMADFRQKYLFASKSRDSLMLEGMDALKNACGIHDLIEKEYAPCTDFSVTEKITHNLCDEIF